MPSRQTLGNGEKKKHNDTTTSTTKNRANVGYAVLSQFAKFGFGRKDAGIKALFSVVEERSTHQLARQQENR